MSDKIINWIVDRKYTCVGVQGIQGCGKTTTCQQIVDKLTHLGRTCIALSIDDFYYPHNQLNGTLRGRPGTHDLEWLRRCIVELRSCEGDVRIPIYDFGANRWRKMYVSKKNEPIHLVE